MELDTSTFILELINFVVLVWLLNRFLFKPILTIMDQRQEQINQSFDEAAQTKEDAELLRNRYECRLEEWEKEKQAAHGHLKAELVEQRDKGLQQTREAIEAERTRLRAQEDKQRADWQRTVESQALKQGALFTTYLLTHLSSEALDTSIINLLIEEINHWPDEKLSELREAAKQQAGQVEIVSARVLTENVKSKIEQTLNEHLGISGNFNYCIDQKLLSGLKINLKPWVMGANLGDELEAFIDSGIHHG